MLRKPPIQHAAQAADEAVLAKFISIVVLMTLPFATVWVVAHAYAAQLGNLLPH